MKEEAEPQGQALAKRTCRGAKRTNKKMLVEKRGTHCKVEAGAKLIELKDLATSKFVVYDKWPS